MNDTIRTATPLHLWIVGGLASLYSLGGGYDYLMTRMENRDYLKSMMPAVDPQVTLDWVNSMPIWAQFGWGLGVWSGLAGSLLLLLRSRFAVHAFALSLIGMFLSFGQQYLGSPAPAELTQGAGQYMPIAIMAVGIALFFYARAMKAKGVLA